MQVHELTADESPAEVNAFVEFQHGVPRLSMASFMAGRTTGSGIVRSDEMGSESAQLGVQADRQANGFGPLADAVVFG